LVEGTFAYLDPMLIVLTSLFFMRVFEQSGALNALNTKMIKSFYRVPALLLILLTLFVMFPGMITGLTAPCVLTTGAMVAPVLMLIGVPRAATGAFIAVAAFYGMVAPPVNICAMIICSGVDMPYVGFGWPLLIATIPLAIFSSFWIAGKYFKKIDMTALEPHLPKTKHDVHGFKLYLPLLFLLILLFGSKVFPNKIPYLGIPLMFVLSALTGFFTGEKVNLRDSLDWSTKQALPILGLLAGIGMFLQVLTLVGARGWIVVSCLELPEWAKFVAMGVVTPLFGGVSAYGASSVLGVPFLLSLLAKNNIIVGAALSHLASVGDFLPPTRLAVVLSAQVVEENQPSKILSYCWIPILFAVLWGLAMIYFANPIGKWLGLS
jgi:TRAP-type C4-dicarboxylate transport system permease large subunit